MESAERAAFAAIGALGERELTAVKAWIASGCEGAQPRPDVESRRVLTERLMAALEAWEVAESASCWMAASLGTSAPIRLAPYCEALGAGVGIGFGNCPNRS